MKTKQGYRMNVRLRTRIIELMASERFTIAEVAHLVGVNQRTVKDYLTDEVRADIAALKDVKVAPATLEDVDRAMLEQARSGNVAAARLVYARMAQKGELEILPTLEELETELRALKHGRAGSETGPKDGEVKG